MKVKNPIDFGYVIGCLLLAIALTNCSNNDDVNVPSVGNIPDPAFEQALIDLGYDDVLDGTLLIANVADVLELSIPDYDFDNTNNDIRDLTGIEFFTSLIKLNCTGQNLTSLNLSNNIKFKRIELWL